MFSRQKVYEPKKAKKRHGFAYWIIGLFTFAIEFMLGLNAAFLVYQSVIIVAENMLRGTGLEPLAAIITLIASLAVGICLVLGGCWTFAGFMDSLDDAKAYRQHYATGRWPVAMVWCLEIAVVALDFTTLMFRSSYFAEKGATSLFAFFVILIFLPPVLGPLMHVLENTPRDRRLAKTRRYAEQLDTDEIEHVVQVMDPDLRSRLLNGDGSALTEHYARVDAIRNENHVYEQQQVAERQRGDAEKNRPLVQASLPQQAEMRSPEHQ
jgi:hypothetical protein